MKILLPGNRTIGRPPIDHATTLEGTQRCRDDHSPESTRAATGIEPAIDRDVFDRFSSGYRPRSTGGGGLNKSPPYPGLTVGNQ